MLAIRRHLVALGALLALTLAPRAHAAPKPVEPPPELLATIAIGPASTLRPLEAYVNAVQPGAGALINDQMVRRGLAEILGAHALDGLDPSAWTYVLVSMIGGTPSFAVVGKVASAKAFAQIAAPLTTQTKGGYGVVSSKPILDKLAGYALSMIATQAAPRVPTATIYLPRVLAQFKPQLAAFKDQMVATLAASGGGMTQLMQSYVDALGALGDDTDRIVITLETTAQIAWLDFALVPRPATRLASFAALQRASDYAMLDRLPATSASIVLAGHLEMGPYRAGFLDVMSAMWGSQSSKDLNAKFEAVAKALTGDLAMAMSFTPGKGMAFTQLYGTADVPAADKAMVALLDLFKTGRTMQMGKASSTITASPTTTQAHGVALRSYDTTMDLSKMTPDERRGAAAMSPTGSQRAYVGTFDKLTMVVVAPDSLEAAGRAIDAARGKSPHFVAGPAIATLLDDARGHKDSLASVIDFGPFLAIAGLQASDLTFLMSLGFADKNVHIRFALPSATLAAATKLSKP
jgi:hypothetical protein